MGIATETVVTTVSSLAVLELIRSYLPDWLLWGGAVALISEVLFAVFIFFAATKTQIRSKNKHPKRTQNQLSFGARKNGSATLLLLLLLLCRERSKGIIARSIRARVAAAKTTTTTTMAPPSKSRIRGTVRLLYVCWKLRKRQR